MPLEAKLTQAPPKPVLFFGDISRPLLAFCMSAAHRIFILLRCWSAAELPPVLSPSGATPTEVTAGGDGAATGGEEAKVGPSQCTSLMLWLWHLSMGVGPLTKEARRLSGGCQEKAAFRSPGGGEKEISGLAGSAANEMSDDIATSALLRAGTLAAATVPQVASTAAGAGALTTSRRSERRSATAASEAVRQVGSTAATRSATGAWAEEEGLEGGQQLAGALGILRTPFAANAATWRKGSSASLVAGCRPKCGAVAAPSAHAAGAPDMRENSWSTRVVTSARKATRAACASGDDTRTFPGAAISCGRLGFSMGFRACPPPRGVAWPPVPLGGTPGLHAPALGLHGRGLACLPVFLGGMPGLHAPSLGLIARARGLKTGPFKRFKLERVET